jgi:hypothetical protein
MATIKFMFSLVMTVLLAGPSLGADQTIRGKTFLVKDPQLGVLSKRLVVTVAKEQGSPNTIVGDPTNIGATLTIIANGGDSSSQAFLLSQGINTQGRRFWQPTKTGYKYGDHKGEQGPVKSAQITRSSAGNFLFKAKLVGQLGPINVVPPDPGVSGYALFQIAGGDRYCMQYADGEIKNNDGLLFKVTNPVAEGCPLAPTTSTSTTSSSTSTTTSTSTSTTIGSPSGAFLD